jgi:hypothetical protein
MPAVPIGLQSYKRTDGFMPEVELVNMLLEKDDSGASPDGTIRVQRPGLTLAYTIPETTVRGVFRLDNFLSGAWFAVGGTTLYRLTAGPTSLGTISGTSRVAFAAGVNLLFVLSDGVLSVWNETTVTAITIPDGYVPIDIEAINGYIIIACSSGRFYWLEPGSVVVDALNFATAESSPDGLVAVRRLVDELFFAGAASIEPWQPSGDLDAPFQKAGGRQYERGLLSRDTMQRFDNSLVWVGDDMIVYRAGSVPQRISDHGIEERLRKRTALPSAWTFGIDGHKLYVLRIPGQGTYGYDASSQAWSEFATTGQSLWQPHVGMHSVDTALCGDPSSGKVWAVDQSAVNDDGIAFRRALSGSVPLMTKGPRNDSLALGIGSSVATTVGIRWKDANEDYPATFEVLPVDQGSSVVTMYRLGSLRAPHRTFEVEFNDPAVRVRVSGMVANEAWQ